MPSRTNAMRLLDVRKIPYEPYEYDPDIRSAAGVAEVLHLPPQEVYKTLVLLDHRGSPLLLMVPGDSEVDLKVFAASAGRKSVRMAPKGEAERLTGLETGGIGALALVGKRWDVYIDRAALQHERIVVNGGRRGCNVRLAVRDVIAVTGAQAVNSVEGEES